MMAVTQDLARRVGIRPACSALGVARATYYRFVTPPSSPKPSKRRPPLKLTREESDEVLDLLHSERFVDSSPRQVWATLLDDDQRYLCSVRTMYRLLESCGESLERRAQRRHPQYEKPELLATSPNEVWSWDITKLRGPCKGVWYYLYLILDVFSRCAVGWMVAPREEGRLAKELPGKVGCCRRSAVSARGSGAEHDVDAERVGCAPVPQPALHEQRQSVLRVPVQNDEIPPKLPRALWFAPGCSGLRGFVPALVQHHASVVPRLC